MPEKTGYMNETKRLRAVKALKDQACAEGKVGFIPTEAEVRALYLLYGGLYVEKPIIEEEEQVVVEAPRRGRRRTEVTE